MLYFLFAGPTYYPSGGARDFVSAHQTLEEAQSAVPLERCDMAYFEPDPKDRALDEVNWAHIATWDGTTLMPITYAPIVDGLVMGWRDWA